MLCIFNDEALKMRVFTCALVAVGRICPLRASQMLESQLDFLALCSFSDGKFDSNAAHAVNVNRPFCIHSLL